MSNGSSAAGAEWNQGGWNPNARLGAGKAGASASASAQLHALERAAPNMKGGIKSDVMSLLNASKSVDVESDANYFLNNTSAAGGGGGFNKMGGKMKGLGKKG